MPVAKRRAPAAGRQPVSKPKGSAWPAQPRSDGSRSPKAVAVADVADAIVQSGEVLRTKKGPVFETAIIAGVMAAKRTHDLIPFCHPLPLEDCKIDIAWGAQNEVVIQCSVRATHKTGVEMEALTGATTAALTVYDMCKALTHGIEIREVALLAKAGGKRDYARGESRGARK